MGMSLPIGEGNHAVVVGGNPLSPSDSSPHRERTFPDVVFYRSGKNKCIVLLNNFSIIYSMNLLILLIWIQINSLIIIQVY
jgi:hypothetical protein